MAKMRKLALNMLPVANITQNPLMLPRELNFHLYISFSFFRREESTPFAVLHSWPQHSHSISWNLL